MFSKPIKEYRRDRATWGIVSEIRSFLRGPGVRDFRAANLSSRRDRKFVNDRIGRLANESA